MKAAAFTVGSTGKSRDLLAEFPACPCEAVWRAKCNFKDHTSVFEHSFITNVNCLKDLLDVVFFSFSKAVVFHLCPLCVNKSQKILLSSCLSFTLSQWPSNTHEHLSLSNVPYLITVITVNVVWPQIYWKSYSTLWGLETESEYAGMIHGLPIWLRFCCLFFS